MLLFGRVKTFRRIEEGLEWKDGVISQAPPLENRAPEGVFVQVPAFHGMDRMEDYIAALAIEAGHVLGDARPSWVQLRGEGVQALPPGVIRDIADAVFPGVSGLGIDLNPRLLGPGDIAGYRSVGVERFCFRMESPYDKVDDPVRRARALGAFASVEVCFSDELNWLSFMHAVGRALESAPSQVSISDERNSRALDSEQMEAAAEKFQKAGYRRLSLWAWGKSDASFDSLGLALSGRAAGLGPDACTFRHSVYRHPGLSRWISTRLLRNYEVTYADGALEQGLELVAGMYAMELKRHSMDFKAHRQVSALVRMGFADKHGKPAAGKPLEFCHKAARLALRALSGVVSAPVTVTKEAKAPGKKGLDLWRTGSGGS